MEPLEHYGGIIPNYSVKDHGEISRIRVLELIPMEGVSTIIRQDEVHPVVGCTLVVEIGLQSYSSVTVLVANPGAIFKTVGYKGRSVSYSTLLPSGEEIATPVSLLVAAGVLKSKAEENAGPVIPEPLPNQIAIAFEHALNSKKD